MPEVFFKGPVGRLEGHYYQQKNIINPPLAIVLHPHPQHGGNMNNKVVYSLYRTFIEHGFNTLRVNFRGVGRSEGEYDNGEGELSDAAAALDWLQSVNPNAKGYWVAGFSFGAWISMQLLMRRPEINSFIAVSPPASMYDFSFLAPCPVSGMIIQGNKDEVVNSQSVSLLAQRLSNQRGLKIDYHEIEDASHFFTNHLSELTSLVSSYIQDFMNYSKQSYAVGA
jgi:hypothetical protein